MINFYRGTLGELIPLIEQLAAEAAASAPSTQRRRLWRSRMRIAPTRRGQLLEMRATGFDLPEDGTWLTAMVSYAFTSIECRDRTIR